jgi:hypothetical protein
MASNQLLSSVLLFFRVTIHNYPDQVIGKIVPFFGHCEFPADRTSCHSSSVFFEGFPVCYATLAIGVHAVQSCSLVNQEKKGTIRINQLEF